MNVLQTVLASDRIRLEPLNVDHAEPLALVGLYPELWALQPAPVDSVDAMRAYVAAALRDQELGTALPFAIVERLSGQVIGSTRYMDIAPAHRRLEIGATWLTPRTQRTGANSEAKRLLLTHAFETLNVHKVVFKTEALNHASRRAILRLGAVEEGTFRQHLFSAAGRARDMVYYAILAHEWPQVKRRLGDDAGN